MTQLDDPARHAPHWRDPNITADCTHRGDCARHPNAQAVHNFDAQDKAP